MKALLRRATAREGLGNAGVCEMFLPRKFRNQMARRSRHCKEKKKKNYVQIMSYLRQLHDVHSFSITCPSNAEAACEDFSLCLQVEPQNTEAVAALARLKPPAPSS